MSPEKSNSSITLEQIESVLRYCVNFAEKTRIVHEMAYLSDESGVDKDLELKMTSLYELSGRVYKALLENPAQPIEALTLDESEKLKYYEKLTSNIINQIIRVNIDSVKKQMSQEGIEHSLKEGTVITIRAKAKRSL